MNDWNIQARAHACQSCGRSFADKEAYHTLLFDEKQAYQRQDVCVGCWETQFSQGANDRKGFVSYWKGVYELPPPPPPDPIRKETAETLLRKLTELNDPNHAAAAFILAVMLERKRILKVKEQFEREGQRVFLYEQPKTGDLFTIQDPNLKLDQLEAVQRDVALLLEYGLNPPPESPVAGSPDAPAAETSPETQPATSSALEASSDRIENEAALP